MSNHLKPLFIVLEGLDGSGTSTQANMLAAYLRRLGARVKLTSEPSGGPVGQLIRSAFGGRVRFMQDRFRFDRQMAYLFAADRHDHLYNDINGVKVLQPQGYWAISTRYYFSSLAYHCETLADREFVKELNAAFPPPDLLIYMDITVEDAMSRLQERSTLDSYENSRKLHVVRENYEWILGEYDGQALRLDAMSPAEILHEQVVERISRLERE